MFNKFHILNFKWNSVKKIKDMAKSYKCSKIIAYRL